MEVTDGYSTVDESITVSVANQLAFTASDLADGFNAVYSIRLKASGLDVSFADGSLDPVEIDSCANTPTLLGSHSKPIYYI